VRLALLTSGGDAPGMNAAIRAIVRCGTERGEKMFGVHRGFSGLIDGEIEPLDNRAVGGIIERGGTMLRSARSAAFATARGRASALASIEGHALDGLIVVGGNGSLRGARWLQEQGVPTVGIPASIDNDVPRTQMSIGVDTALNTVVDALNRIRDTAVAHERAFVIEVMGRTSGYIALHGGLAGGAEVILLPESRLALADVVESVCAGVRKGKRHSIIVVAEGFEPTDLPDLKPSPGRAVAHALEENGTVDTRLTILGHLQRGGSPTAFDRILACRFAEAAVEWLIDGQTGIYAGLDAGRLVPVPFAAIEESCQNVDLDLLRLANVLAH
jgi:6-phosphofructokinase 1